VCRNSARPPRRPGRPGRGRECGMVTAEAAFALPLVAAFALVMVFLVMIGLSKLATVDAARDAARAVARGDSPAVAAAAAEQTAPDGANVVIARTDGQVAVTVTALVDAPSWLLVPMPDIDVESRAVVRAEPGAHVDE
jgi:hypothetical protein